MFQEKNYAKKLINESTNALKLDEAVQSIIGNIGRPKESYSDITDVSVHKSNHDPQTETEILEPMLNEDIIDSILKKVNDDPLDASTNSDDNAIPSPYLEEDLTNIMKNAVEDLKPKVESVLGDFKDIDIKLIKDEFIQCEECIFVSKIKSVMQEHERSVHCGEVRFSCAICQYKSYFKHNIRCFTLFSKTR